MTKEEAYNEVEREFMGEIEDQRLEAEEIEDQETLQQLDILENMFYAALDNAKHCYALMPHRSPPGTKIDIVAIYDDLERRFKEERARSKGNPIKLERLDYQYLQAKRALDEKYLATKETKVVKQDSRPVESYKVEQSQLTILRLNYRATINVCETVIPKKKTSVDYYPPDHSLHSTLQITPQRKTNNMAKEVDENDLLLEDIKIGAKIDQELNRRKPLIEKVRRQQKQTILAGLVILGIALIFHIWTALTIYQTNGLTWGIVAFISIWVAETVYSLVRIHSFGFLDPYYMIFVVIFFLHHMRKEFMDYLEATEKQLKSQDFIKQIYDEYKSNA